MKESKSYKLSFTAGGLLLGETRIVLQVHNDVRNWEETKKILLKDNLLAERVETTARRKFHEIRLRYEERTNDFLDYMLDADDEGFRLAAWYSVCATYRFVAEFALEVVFEKVSNYDYKLSSEDYDAFFNTKAGWSNKLNNLKPSTANKIKQVMFRMLREADLMSNANRLFPVHIDHHLINLIKGDRKELLLVFPDQALVREERCA